MQCNGWHVSIAKEKRRNNSVPKRRAVYTGLTEAPMPTRRQFLTRAATVAAGAGAATAVGRTSSAKAADANERLTVAIIGSGGQAKGLLTAMLPFPDVKVGWLCDVDQARIDQALAHVDEVSLGE